MYTFLSEWRNCHEKKRKRKIYNINVNINKVEFVTNIWLEYRGLKKI